MLCFNLVLMTLLKIQCVGIQSQNNKKWQCCSVGVPYKLNDRENQRGYGLLVRHNFHFLTCGITLTVDRDREKQYKK